MLKFKTRNAQSVAPHKHTNAISELPHRGLMAVAVVGMAIGLIASSAISSDKTANTINQTTSAQLESNENEHVAVISELSINTTEIENLVTTRLSLSPDSNEIRWFNNRPIRQARILKMKVTAYSPDEKSCGKHADGITASGYSVWTNAMKLVAADTDMLPFGTLLSIPGYDNANIVPVLDRGSAIKGNRLDVLYPTHEAALEWGVQELDVIVWEYADGLQDDFTENHH